MILSSFAQSLASTKSLFETFTTPGGMFTDPPPLIGALCSGSVSHHKVTLAAE
jgi:hypothetical protein